MRPADPLRHCCACARPDLPLGALCRPGCEGMFCADHGEEYGRRPEGDVEPPDPPAELTGTCARCGAEFVSSRAPRGRPRRYCSRSCSQAAARQGARQRAAAQRVRAAQR